MFPTMPTAWIAMGANLGDRAGTLASALKALKALPGVRRAEASPLYETAPVGGPSQPPFLNACVRLRLAGDDPEALMASLLAIETAHGRLRAERWGPRILDLDLLLFDARVQDSPTLTLPHPRFHERAFVLKPLADLDPSLRCPLSGAEVSALLARVDQAGVLPWKGKDVSWPN